MVTTIRLSGPLNRPHFLQGPARCRTESNRPQASSVLLESPNRRSARSFHRTSTPSVPVMLLDKPDDVVVLIGRD